MISFESLGTVLNCFVLIVDTCWKNYTRALDSGCFCFDFRFSSCQEKLWIFSGLFHLLFEVQAGRLVRAARSICRVSAVGFPDLDSSDFLGGARVSALASSIAGDSAEKCTH